MLLCKNNLATAVGILIFAMDVLPADSQEAARIRCQKSGCREGSASAEEPALIVARKSPSAKSLSLLTSWIVAFLLLRLGAHYLRKLIPRIRRKTPEIREAVGHYYNSCYDSIVLTSAFIKSKLFSERTVRRVKSGRRLRSRVSSNRSLGSLADLLDDSSDDRSSRGSSLWYYDDSSTAGYSSAFTTSSSNDSAMESQSEIGLSVLSSESSTDSTSYNDYNHNSDDQSRGGDSVVSKFLNYISKSRPDESQYYAPTQRMNGSGLVKRRPSLDYSVRHSHDTVGKYDQIEKGTSRKRRSTVDETNYPSYRSQNATIDRKNQRSESSNAPESLLIAKSKPPNGGVKQRMAAAKTKPKRQDYGNSDYYDETKSFKRQQQQQMRRHGKEDQNEKSGLHHHLSKFSSSSKDDNENYSTMLSTVDLRS